MKYVLIFLLITNSISLRGQLSGTDSLIQQLEKIPEDTNRVHMLLKIASSLYFYKPHISFEYSNKALKLSRKLGFTTGVLNSLRLVGESSRLMGDYPGALKFQLEALTINRKINNVTGEASSLTFIGVTYLELQEYRDAVRYLLQANILREKLPLSPDGLFSVTNTGIAYSFLKMPDSALYYLQMANRLNEVLRHPQLKSLISRRIGGVYFNMGKNDSALFYYYISLHNSIVSNESINRGPVQQQIAELYESIGKNDSAMFYVQNAYSEAQRTAGRSFLMEASQLLVRLYRKQGKRDSAFFYQDIVTALNDSLYGIEKLKRLQLLMLDEQKKQQQALQEQERYKSKTKMIALWSAIGIFLVIAFILYRNNRQKQKANNKLEATLSDLKTTQSHLIQSEKMASLGELTAGIAHEIQNPLNFVNNFSEVNKELLTELNEELEKGNYLEARTIARDAIENQEKINHHGKRADAIVKGMLQHSRSSTGQKEAADINALCDEYLRLAYHGMRAKDKSFNASTKTEFDINIGKVNVVSQDIGRVILNLINNAFYAVDEKKKQVGDGFEPIVTVSTKSIKPPLGGLGVEIKVADNGNGIPQKIMDKIFQPFFTTKPTGQGTGLGLSLAYDIIKAHGGEITVNTKEGEYTEFMLRLPSKD